MVINAGPLGAIANSDIAHAFKGLQGGVHPILGRCAINRWLIHNRATTPMGCLFDQQNARACAPCRECCGQTRDATTNDHDVNVNVEMLIRIVVTCFGSFAQTSGLANDRLIHVFPERTWVDEHFVVKASWQEARQVLVHRAHVKFQRRPVVLGRRGQTIVKLGRGDPLVGLKV